MITFHKNQDGGYTVHGEWDGTHKGYPMIGHLRNDPVRGWVYTATAHQDREVRVEWMRQIARFVDSLQRAL